MQWTRRTLLGSIASASVPLAGCSMDGPADGSSDGGTGGGEFERVAVEGQTLVVGLGDLSADTVNVITPDGTAFASRSVAQGATTVEVDIGLSYEPGEYQVVASADESTVAETSLTIAPELEVLDVGVGANHSEEMPQDLNFANKQAIVEIANQGTGPEVLEQLLVLEGVPNPTTDLAQDDVSTSGIYDVEDGYGDLEQPVVPPQETVVFYTTTMPFAFVGNGVDCKSEPQTEICELRIPVKIGTQDETVTFPVEYSGSEQSGECSIVVESGEA